MTNLQDHLQRALAGRYTIERELGRGGAATVFLAQDLKHRRPVAVKVLNPELARSVGPDRFLREIEIAARLTHPHILPVFDSGAADGVLYYVMPYIQGETLRHRLSRDGQLPLADALRIGREIAAALDYAHRQGIVHRDVKPENVLLEDGHAVVADFGVARALAAAGEAPLTQSGLAIGTPSYMSPEQSSGEEGVDGRSDIYALGCVVYEMLAGAPPFAGANFQRLVHQHLLETPPPIAARRPDVPAGVAAALDRALAKHPSQRFGTAADFGAALLADGPTPPGTPTRHRRTRRAALAVGSLLVVGAVLLVLRGRGPATLDSNLVAVAPFDVLVPTLDLWREGLVDVLSRDLDGAGPLRTVAPTIVVRRWSGRADAPSAAALAQSTGARLAVFGQVLGSGGDSVRVNATLYDVAAGRAVAEFQLRDLSDRIDRVADSLTVALLRELGRTRPIGAVRLASLGSSSLPALKAFLQGEQYYRRTAWDSAIAAYRRAIDTDSTFAPALHRVGLAMGWQRSGFDSLSRTYHLRAGAFNHGLSPRDSLLITADSLSASLYSSPYGLAHWSRMRRLFATLDEATQRYPTDPEVWYALGDARYHFGVGPHLGVDERQILESFDRAITLDSAFGPSYIHPVQLGLALDGPAGAARYRRPYLALASQDVDAQGIRLSEQLVEREGDTRQRQQLLDTASLDALHHAALAIHGWPDSGETALTVLRALRERVPPRDTAKAREMLVYELLYRGHLRAAVREASPRARTVIAQAGLGGAVPADSVSRALARALRRDTVITPESARWWASTGDTAMLHDAIVLADGMARGEIAVPPFTMPTHAGAREVGRYAGQSLRGYLALARGDSNQALVRFQALPDTLCHTCAVDRLTTAQLLAGRGRYAEAAVMLAGHRVRSHGTLEGGFWALERARVNERLGERARALEDFRFVADVWRHADPELKPFVDEAHVALQRLGAEPLP